MAEKTKVRKRYRLAPCPSYDVERLESWLQDMAKDGWVLEGESAYWFGFFTFVKTEPQDVRYRLEPKTKRHSNFTNAPDEEEEELYKEYGWEFVTQFHYFYIYRTADPNARELNTDLAVQATALKAVKRNASSSLIFQVWLIAYWFYRLREEASRFLVSFDWAILPLFLLILISTLIVDGKRFLHIRKLRKQLKSNIPLEHDKPWKKNSTAHRIGSITLAALYIYFFVTAFSSCFNTMSASYENTPTAEYPGNPPFVTCEDFGTFTKRNFLSGYNAYKTYSTSLAPTIIEWKEYGEIVTEDGRTIEGSLIIDYYETTSPDLARGLVDDFLHHYEDFDEFQIVDAPDIDVDHVVAFHYIYPTILIQHGNIFISASVSLEYQEEILWEEWAQRMAESLQK